MKAKTLAVLWLSTWVGCGSEQNAEPRCEPSPGHICTFIGTGHAGFDGDGQPLRKSELYWPIDMTFASNGDAYVLDWNNHRVRRVNEDDTLETVIGTSAVGDGPPGMADLVQPGVDGTTIDLNHPTQLLELPGGALMLVAWHNHKLRHYDPETGLVYVTCGRGAGFVGDDGEPITEATRLNQPAGGVVASDGTIYLLDQRNQRVRKIGADDTIDTVVGTGEMGFSGDGGPPLQAQLNLPMGSNPPPAGTLTLDADGRLYISDTLNHRIRRVDFTADVIETVAGNGMAAFSGDGGPATEASLNNPRDLEIGPDRRLYIADEWNHRVRVVDLATATIDTVVGTGEQGFAGDGGPANQAMLDRPTGVAFDLAGDLYVADSHNNRIRLIGME